MDEKQSFSSILKMNYTPSLTSFYDYYVNGVADSYEYDPNRSDDCIKDPYVLDEKTKQLIIGRQPIGKIKMIRTSEGEILIKYLDQRTKEYRQLKSSMPIPESQRSLRYIRLDRELLVVNDDLNHLSILSRAKKIFKEICLRRDLWIKPNPDTDVIVHLPQGLYHSIVIY